MTEIAPKIEESPKKTPAEIAADLEKKAALLDVEGKKADATRKRELAKKVLAVESDAVTGTTELKLEALQSKLPSLEKKDLEDARKIAVVTAGAGVVGGIAAAAMTMSDKVDNMGFGKLWLGDSIKTWITEALSEKPEAGFFGGIMHKLQLMFLLPLAKMFGVTMPKEGQKNGKTEEGDSEKNADKNDEKKQTEMADKIWFTAGYKWFIRIYANSTPNMKEIDASKIDSVFSYAAFQNLTFQEADVLYKKHATYDKKWLLKDMKMENTLSPDIVHFGLGLIVTSKGREFLEKKYPDGMATKTIGEIFTNLKDQFNIAANLEAIEINGLQDIGGFMGEIGKKMDLAFDEDGQVKTPHLKEKIQKLWLDKKDLIFYAMVQDPQKPITDFLTHESVEWLQLEAESKGKLREIVMFGNKMQQSIAQSFSFGNQQIYANYLKSHPLTLSDTLKLYAILGGKTEQNLMSSPEQLYVYQKVWHILWHDPGLRGTYFDTPISSALWDKGSNIQMPEEVKKVLENLMSKAIGKFKEKAKGVAKELWAYLDATTIIAIGAALAAYFIWGKKIWLVFTGATLATLTYSIAIILKNSAGSDGNITLSSGQKYTPDNAAKIIVEDAKDKI